MKKVLRSIFATLFMMGIAIWIMPAFGKGMNLGGFISVKAETKTNVRYIDENGDSRIVTSGTGSNMRPVNVIVLDSTLLENNSYNDEDDNNIKKTKLGVGWYIVESNITIDYPIVLNGNVNLILANNVSFNMNIDWDSNTAIVGNNNNLNIYSQSLGSSMGVFMVGAGYRGVEVNNLTICGGKVTIQTGGYSLYDGIGLMAQNLKIYNGEVGVLGAECGTKDTNIFIYGGSAYFNTYGSNNDTCIKGGSLTINGGYVRTNYTDIQTITLDYDVNNPNTVLEYIGSHSGGLRVYLDIPESKKFIGLYTSAYDTVYEHEDTGSRRKHNLYYGTIRPVEYVTVTYDYLDGTTETKQVIKYSKFEQPSAREGKPVPVKWYIKDTDTKCIYSTRVTENLTFVARYDTLVTENNITVSDMEYSGSCQDPVVKYNDIVLRKGVDYSVVYKKGSTVLESSPREAGDYVAEITGLSHYTGSSVTKTFKITCASVSVTNLHVKDKEYNGKTNAVIDDSEVEINGIVEGDKVSFSYLGAFRDAKIGTEKDVNISISMTGDDAPNYTIDIIHSNFCGKADIVPAKITVTGVVAKDKEYDGNTNAEIDITNEQVVGIVENEDVLLSYAGSFRTKDSGTDKPVDITVTLSGDDAENYIVDTENSDLTVKATIDPAKVTVAGLIVKDKEYDGTTAAEVDDADMWVDGVVEGDKVDISYSAEYADAKMGVDKEATLTISLSGKDAANYVINELGSSSKNQQSYIDPAKITITGLTVKAKEYDGTWDAELDYSNVKVTNIVEGEDVTLSYSAYFEDVNIGINKPVTVTVTLSGKDAGNYEINTDASDLLLYSDIYKLAPEPETVLRVAGTEVKEGSISASGKGWSYSETEDRAMLTLNGFTYEGEGPAIWYIGDKPLEITYKGDNTIKVNSDDGDSNAGIWVNNSKAGFILSGGRDDSLNMTTGKDSCGYVLFVNNIRFTGEGTVAIDSSGYGIVASDLAMEGGMLIAYGGVAGIVAETVKVTDGTLLANGRTEDGIYVIGEGDAVILEGGAVIAACDLEEETDEPKGCGIWAPEANIIIGEKASLTASTRSTGSEYTAINGKVINKIKGTGWMDIDDLDATEAIEASEAGQTLAYKGVMFPEKKKDNGSGSGESTSGGTTGGGEGGTVNDGESSGTGGTTGGTDNGKDGKQEDQEKPGGSGTNGDADKNGGTAGEGGASGEKPGEENGTDKPGVAENKGGNGSEGTVVPENGGNDDSGWFSDDDGRYKGQGLWYVDENGQMVWFDYTYPTDPTGQTGSDAGTDIDDGTGTGKDIPGKNADDGITIPDEDDGSAEPVIQRQTTTNDTADDGTKTAITSTTYTDGSKVTEKVVEKPDGSTTSTTTTTEADGTKVVEKVEEKADGSSKATTTTTTTDGARTTETIEKKADGTEVKTQTVKDADGSSTTEKVEKKTDGTVTTTNTENDADGASTTEKVVAKPDGSVTTTNTVKDADGNVLSTGKVIEKTKENGVKTITATEKNADGSSSTSKTTVETDGSSKTNTTINNADGTTTKEKVKANTDGSLTRTATTTDEDGNVLSVEKEKVTVSKSGTETSTTTTENADGSKSEKTVKTKTDGTSSSTETSTDVEGNVTVTIGSTKKDGTSTEKSYAVDEDGQMVLTGIESTTTSASIPASVKVNGKSVPVTSIGEGAMKDNKTVKTVKIASSVTSIGENAFSGAKNLKTIKLSANVTEIAPGAFDGIKSNATFYISAETDEEFYALVELLKKSGVGSKVKFKRA